ncbi:MAG: tetratricopeptide repeat protein, partial [Planctomycetota bacterium]|nr:tetratricopeptide repeat protein [Planctomycetota bacterium]
VTHDRLAKVWNTQTGEVIASAWEDVEYAWFGVDDRFLVTLRESKCQVWDAATAEPVSLPFELRRDDSSHWNENLAVVDAQGDHLLSLCGADLVVWDLSPDSRPMETVAAEIQSASGHSIDARGGYSPRAAADTVAAWKKCRVQSEDARSKDSRDAIRWHEQSARLYEQALHTDRHHPPAQTQGYWFATGWHLERLVAAGRRDPAIQYRLGQAQRELGRFVEADSSLSAALAANGAAPAAWWFARGQARAGLGRIDDAIADAAQAVETGFDEGLTEQPEWAKQGAIRGLDRLLMNSPTNVDLLRRRAELHWNLNHWGPGLADFEALLVESPADKNPWLHHRRGDCLTGLGRFEEAIAAYSLALGPTEDDPILLHSRAGARALLGQYDEAIADLERAKPLWSNPFEPTMNAALVHLLAGDQANYERELSAAVEPMIGAYGDRWTSHMPDEVAIEVTWLAALGPARQRAEQYLELAENVARRSPDNPQARLSLGAMRLACGNATGAVEALTPIAESPKGSVTAAALLALCWTAQNDAIQANVWRERLSALLAGEQGSVALPWPHAASKKVLVRRTEVIPSPP